MKDHLSLNNMIEAKVFVVCLSSRCVHMDNPSS